MTILSDKNIICKSSGLKKQNIPRWAEAGKRVRKQRADKKLIIQNLSQPDKSKVVVAKLKGKAREIT